MLACFGKADERERRALVYTNLFISPHQSIYFKKKTSRNDVICYAFKFWRITPRFRTMSRIYISMFVNKRFEPSLLYMPVTVRAITHTYNLRVIIMQWTCSTCINFYWLFLDACAWMFMSRGTEYLSVLTNKQQKWNVH